MLFKPKYIENNRIEMLDFVTNQPRVTLEVGCREALFSEILKKNLDVQETWGVDPDKNEQMIEKAKKNLDCFISDYFSEETKHLFDKKFDLIIFNDVLEHMYDPWEMLQFSRQLLTDEGIVIASLPNIRHKSIVKQLLFNDNFEYEEFGIMDITHIRFFTKKSMIKMFEDCGFEIVKVDTTFKKKKKLYKKIFDFITGNRFESLRVYQYGLTAKRK